jgi:hypothetical protein
MVAIGKILYGGWRGRGRCNLRIVVSHNQEPKQWIF